MSDSYSNTYLLEEAGSILIRITTRSRINTMPVVGRSTSHVNPFSTIQSFQSMKFERARLASFSEPPGWPTTIVTPEACARAGFFSIRDGDKVQCAFCRGILGIWEEGDTALGEHRRHFPRCPFVVGLPVGNVPIMTEDEVAVPGRGDAASVIREELRIDFGVGVTLGTGTGEDVCGTGAVQVTTDLKLERELAMGTLGIKLFGNGPAFPCFKTMSERLKSFVGGGGDGLDLLPKKKWPLDEDDKGQGLNQSKEKMAEAGFFYVGKEDHVRCFHCGGGLKNWEGSDDPWVEHARWFPKCTFMTLCKGDEFISEACAEMRSKFEAAMKNEGKVKGKDNLKEGQDQSPCEDRKFEVSLPKAEAGSSKSTSGDITTKTEKSVTSTSTSTSDLRRELEELNEMTRCKICLENEVSIVFLPCGHLVSCGTCASALTKCALCRQPIKAVVRTYLS